MLAVACPPPAEGGCGSDPGARCLGKSGRVVRSHAARMRAALTAAHLRQAGPIGEALADSLPGPGGTFAVDAAGTAEVPVASAPELEPTGLSKAEATLRLLVLKVLAGRIAEADADTRDEAVGVFDVGDSIPGYLTPDDAAAARRGETDRCLGKVGLSKPSKSPKVLDADAFTAWALEHAPDEVEHRPVVRNSFLSAVIASYKKHGGYLTPDGELVDVPGIDVVLGRPTLQVRPSEDAADLVAEALAAGLLTVDGTRALPAGGAA